VRLHPDSGEGHFPVLGKGREKKWTIKRLGNYMGVTTRKRNDGKKRDKKQK